MGSSVLILLVCLCINYPELRTLPGRAQPDYWLYYYLLQIINYRELRAKRGSRLGGDGGRYWWLGEEGRWGGGERETTDGRKAPLSDLCFQLISVN